MGNQLTGIAPSQIYPVEHYLADLNDFTFISSLGSTRFFKVALARFREGLLVVKVFANPDPMLSLTPCKEILKAVRNKLQSSTNCLPFQKDLITDKAGLLIRQYVKFNLYDRISTRPFLNVTEKKWLAYQILCAVSQSHKSDICHGDIKLENIMVTSWNWVFLTDFASFKPTYLPEDNPADYSYFFDTSRRRTCYIAPERFKAMNPEASSNNTSNNPMIPNDDFLRGELCPTMDVFSVGCALAELFTEGNAPFDFSQLLSYRTGDYNPWKVLEKIEDASIREMVRHMLQKEPSHRLSIDEYLEMQRDKAFPDYFYSFLKVYIQQFSVPVHISMMYSPDDKVKKLKSDLSNILKVICDIDESDNDVNGKDTQGLVIIVSLLTSNLRSLQLCDSKLDALGIIKTLSKYVSSDIILDRLLPYISHFLNDTIPRVRSSAIRTLTFVLTMVQDLPRSDDNIFPEYIFPNLAHVLDDSSVYVRMEYAQNIASLAETALRFLEVTQARDNNDEMKADTEDCISTSEKPLQMSFDKELQALHEMIQQIVSQLLSDHDNMVKNTLLRSGLTRLCIVFGLQKANDLLLSHMITFLNHKQDRHLREAFFDSIVGVAVYIGWQSSPILKPLIQQGLRDTEESVICKSIDTLTNLTELGLMNKSMLLEMLKETVIFLCHPNLWIRQAAVGFICTVAKMIDIVDVHCKIQPLVRPFTIHPVIQLEKELVLLSCLDEPVPRAVLDYLVKRPLVAQLLEHIQERQIVRNITRPGHLPAYEDIDPLILPLFRRLQADGMSETFEDKLLIMKDYILKIYHRNTLNENKVSSVTYNGVIKLSKCSSSITSRSANLNEWNGKDGMVTGANRKQLKKKSHGTDSPNIVMNKEWQYMFGASEPKSMSRSRQSSSENLVSNKSAELSEDSPDLSKMALKDLGSNLNQATSSKSKQMSVICHMANCKTELNNLVLRKQALFNHDTITKESLDTISENLNSSYSSWKPTGQLIAHLHEHRAAINKLIVIPDTALFASCSNDGTVRIWDCGKMEVRSIANRSRQTYNIQGAEITSMAICKSTQCLAAASDHGTIHVFHFETNSTKITHDCSRTVDLKEDGYVVDMDHVDAGSQSVLAYATSYGSLIGWDLRTKGNAWKFENNYSNGLITSMCIDPRHCWVVAGTSNGSIICWDLRFQLPISKITHGAKSMIHKLILHPYFESVVISAIDDNNEVDLWDLETDSRLLSLWSSTSPPLSTTMGNGHSVRSMIVSAYQSSEQSVDTVLYTAGTDMTVRYWDISNNKNSKIIKQPAMESKIMTASYNKQLVDGTSCMIETLNRSEKPKSGASSSEDAPRRGPGIPPDGHYDTISDISLINTAHHKYLLSASKDGVIKIWK